LHTLLRSYQVTQNSDVPDVYSLAQIQVKGLGWYARTQYTVSASCQYCQYADCCENLSCTFLLYCCCFLLYIAML